MRFVEPPLIRRQTGVQLRLGLRNLYIVPTRFGLLWLAAAALLQVVAMQLSSNGTLLLSFLMLGWMLLAMHLTHDNLRGLEIRCGVPRPGVARQAVGYPVILRTRSARLALRLSFRHAVPHELRTLPAGERQLDLVWRPTRRGLQQPGPLHVETTAPLGLFVCWSRWEPATPQLIVPARLPGPVAVQAPQQWQDGLEEWLELRPHRPGERLALVDWASVAKGRRLQTKRFADPDLVELMLEPAPGVERERGLEHLADRIWQLHQRGVRYGLRLPGFTIAAQAGAAHRDACLAALATA